MAASIRGKKKARTQAARESEQKRLERKAARQSRRRDEIIGAAHKLAESAGLEGFTADDVARAVAMSTPSVFYYFPGGLTQIRAAVAVQRFHARCQRAIERARAAPTGVDALVAWARGLVTAYMDDPDGMGSDFEVMQRGGWGEELIARHIAWLNAVFGMLEEKLLEDKARGEIHPDIESVRRTGVLMNQLALGIVASDQLRRKVGGGSKHAVQAFLDDLCGLIERGVRR